MTREKSLREFFISFLLVSEIILPSYSYKEILCLNEKPVFKKH